VLHIPDINIIITTATDDVAVIWGEGRFDIETVVDVSTESDRILHKHQTQMTKIFDAIQPECAHLLRAYAIENVKMMILNKTQRSKYFYEEDLLRSDLTTQWTSLKLGISGPD
jgi:hypothetical protein